MRMYKKREILQCIDTLKKGNRKLKLVKYNAGHDVIEQSQELAIMVGNQIEECEGETSVVIKYLEEYCELLYKAYICTNNTEYRIVIKEIDVLLKRIERSVKEDIPNSAFEIVFLPYKAAMWDSLDSIYRVFANDKDCHVVVMPVPYYNLDQKDRQVEMHYEGNQLPKDIPITDYRLYSLEEVRPDVIFIHNPYDQFNYVTQLPEKYFSSSLIQYTDHLVYIPYFITKGDSIKEDYCILPAVKNAWRTFVQSNAVKKCYLKYGADANKIVAMGSPKFDMVFKMQKNPPEIPEKWRNTIKGCKVFLLNTHLKPIITEAEKLIDKLHRIFRLFQEYDNAVLLWRPHPLSIETAKSMNPQMLEKYLETVEEFKTLDNGIYDDTPDIHRAIAISDAYIGDWSSVVTLYGVTGKPIYITGIDIDTNIEESTKEKEEKKKGISFSCVAELDGYLWAPGDGVNGLFRINENTGETKFITSFDKEDSYGKLLYKGVVAYGRQLFFIPDIAGYIARYAIDTGRMEYYDIRGRKKKDRFVVCGYTVRGNKLYLFPRKVRDIICFDMEKGEIQYCNWNYKELPSEIKDSAFSMFLHKIHIGDVEYLPCVQTNMFVKLDMNSFQSEAIRLEGSKEGVIDVAYENNILYFLTTGGNIFEYNIETQKTKLFWENIERNSEGIPYYQILVYDNFLWLIPGFNEHIYRINIKTIDAFKVSEFPDDFSVSEEPEPYPYKWIGGEVRKGELNLYPCRANMLLKWAQAQIKADGVKIQRPKGKAWEKYILSPNTEGYIYYENSYSLFYFLDIVLKEKDEYKGLRKDYFQKMQVQTDGKCGENIWTYIKNNLLDM